MGKPTPSGATVRRGLRVPGSHRRARLRRAGRPRSRRTRSSSPTDRSATAATSRRSSPPNCAGRDDRSGLPGLRRHERDGRPHRPAGADGRYAGSSTSGTAANGFRPCAAGRRSTSIYLCYPNNPTGAVATRAVLRAWVDWARGNQAVILFDAAYEAYIRDPDVPHSIYEIEGARECAIEFRSFSKTAGFTGTRCAFTVVPKELQGGTARASPRASTRSGSGARRRSSTACPTSSSEARRQLHRRGAGAADRCRLLHGERADHPRRPRAAGFQVYGGENAPYIWVKTPRGWTRGRLRSPAHQGPRRRDPGVGFGPSGEGYFRFTAFGRRDQTEEAVERIRTRLRR